MSLLPLRHQDRDVTGEIAEVLYETVLFGIKDLAQLLFVAIDLEFAA